ncbi:MAG: hypothetical protein ABSH14_03625 [Verrucomicrobiia bacterium]|jgi:hypothetical protein
MSYNLLVRLEGYSQNPIKRALENFTTEVMAYLINEDSVFRREFVRHVIPDGRLARGFSRASAKTQQEFDFRTGIVDLVLFGRRGRILIEVKIGASETWTNPSGKGWVPQVQKYLSYGQGPVVYLSTKRVPTPAEVCRSKRFLGHVYLEDLYAKLNDKRDSLTEIGRTFLGLMEENQMTPVRPFNKTDLRDAHRAFKFATKCEGILQEIMILIEPDFRKLFHSKTCFTSASFSPADESAYSYSKNFTRGNVTWVTIWIGPWHFNLDFGVVIHVRNAKENLKKLNRSLKWKDSRSTLYTSHEVGSDMRIHEMADIVLKDLRRLRTVLK